MNRTSRAVLIAATVCAVAAAAAIVAVSMRYQDRLASGGGTAGGPQAAGGAPAAHVPPSSPAPGAAQAGLLGTGFRYLGVYEGSDTSPGQYAKVERFAHTIGRQPNIVLSYSYWGQDFSTSFAQTAAQHGAALLIDLDPTSASCASIAAGHQDAYLESYARSVKAFGQPVIISFGHEMNGSWYPWGWTHTRPATFVRAWRHIVRVFRRAGADNVIWLWTVNSVGVNEGPIADYWPGARYVTWAAVDAYYYYQDDDFTGVFGSSLAAIRRVTKKPVLIGETAIGQVSGQAADIPGLFAGVSGSGLIGFVWYDQAQRDGIYHQDWRLEGHPRAIAAFRAAASAYVKKEIFESIRTPSQVIARYPALLLPFPDGLHDLPGSYPRPGLHHGM